MLKRLYPRPPMANFLLLTFKEEYPNTWGGGGFYSINDLQLLIIIGQLMISELWLIAQWLKKFPTKNVQDPLIPKKEKHISHFSISNSFNSQREGTE